MPKVSIIVPVYNAVKTIERCARSLMEQTLQDIEVIFVDDCSKDGSFNLIMQLTKDDPRCKVLQNEYNMGCSSSRRVGLQVAQGDYVIACDADDWVEPDYCESLYNNTQGGADIVWCDFYKNDGQSWEVVKQLPANEQFDINAEIRSLLLNHRQGALWNHLVKRQLYKSVAEFPSKNMAEDLTVLLQLYLSANSVMYVPKPLYHYDFSSVSLSHVSTADADIRLVKQARDMEENVRLLERCFKKQGVYDKFNSEFVFRKFFNKRWMLPALHRFSDCSVWRNIHPEINFRLFGNKYISISEKVTSALCLCGIYPLIRKMIKGR